MDKQIGFSYGAFAKSVVPEKENEAIRGKRSKLPMLLYDYEYCNQEDIDKVIEPFMRKE